MPRRPNDTPSSEERKCNIFALLMLYEKYKDMFVWCIDNPTGVPKEMNIFYLRKLKPELERLIGIVRMPIDSGDAADAASMRIVPHLFGISAWARKVGVRPEEVREDVMLMYGDIKTFAEAEGAASAEMDEELRALVIEASEYASRSGSDNDTRIQLDDYEVTFDEETGVITAGDRKCKLTPYEQLFYFAREMWTHPVDTPVSVDIIAEALEEGGGPVAATDVEKNVYDRMYRLNRAVRDTIHTEDNLFERKNGCIIRRH